MVVTSSRPDSAVVALSSPHYVFKPDQVVLGAQRAVLGARIGCLGGRGGTPITPGNRARLVALALRALTESAIAAEAECRRIVESADLEAAAIVQTARDDVEWLARRWRADADEPRTEAAQAAAVLQLPPRPRTRETIHLDDEIGQEFFASFAARDEDPWGFMDHDFVGAAPALLRRVLRRPASLRRQPVGGTR